MARAFRPWTFLVLLWAVNVCINAFYIAPSAVFPDLIPDLGITKGQAGLLISLYLVAILLFQVLGGYASDRVDPRRTIVAASFALLGLSALMYIIPRYDVLLGLRFLAGVPVAFVFAPSAFLVSRAFADAPGRAVGIFLSCAPAGVSLGNLLSPAVADAYGWPVVLVAFNLPLLVLVPAFVLVARGLPPREHESFPLRDYLSAFRSRELWKVGLAFACSYAAYIFYSSWTPTYLEETGLVAVGLIALVAAAIPAAGILSRPLGGHLAETRFARDKRWVPGMAFLLLLGTSLAIPFASVAGIPLLIAAGFLAQLPFPVYYLFSTQVMPKRFSGTAYALMNTTSLIGGAVAPTLAGVLTDTTGSFLAAFAMAAGVGVAGLLLTLSARVR